MTQTEVGHLPDLPPRHPEGPISKLSRGFLLCELPARWPHRAVGDAQPRPILTVCLPASPLLILLSVPSRESLLCSDRDLRLQSRP